MVPQQLAAGKALAMLNKLIRVNNDRIANYRHVLAQSANLDIDLRDLFKHIIKETESNKVQLSGVIRAFNGKPTPAVTLSGRIHRAWFAAKIYFSGTTRKMVISSCLYNEQVAGKAYSRAMKNVATADDHLLELISSQQAALVDVRETLIKTARQDIPSPTGWPILAKHSFKIF